MYSLSLQQCPIKHMTEGAVTQVMAEACRQHMQLACLLHRLRIGTGTHLCLLEYAATHLEQEQEAKTCLQAQLP